MDTTKKHEFGAIFIDLNEKYLTNNNLFHDFRLKISVFIESHEQNTYIRQGAVTYLYVIANDTFFKNSIPMFQAVHIYTMQGHTLEFTGVLPELVKEIIELSAYITPILENSKQLQQQQEKELSISLKTLKDTILQRTYKKIYIITNWLVKWAGYMQQEESFKADTLKAYKQGEVLLVEFGFRIGNEMGGRHYAVVVEKNNNPKSGTIILSPISSYFPGQKLNLSNVDLGIGAINDSKKGAEIIVNQTGYFSKMRIERPKRSGETIARIPNDKMDELITKLQNKISRK